MESERQPFSPREETFRHFEGELNTDDNSPQIYHQGFTNSIESPIGGAFLVRDDLFRGKGREMSVRTSLSLFPRRIEAIEEDPHNFGVELAISLSPYDINRPIEG